ncbi:glycosyltransferase family 8 protein [Streptococcus sp. ZJ93]|uniref:glycosyltransferase family 8 protein n=1 Tax=Streptococcus handemini TaxID=3161188 RepID=UPI0034D6024F
MNIAMVADVYYKEQLEVAMKSIMLYNQNVHFFLLNKDFSQEWFEKINHYLGSFDSCITDCKIEVGHYSGFATNKYITEATFYRYHLPEFIKEEKVLYLDVDLIVTENLQSFYNTDIGNVGLAGIEDIGIAFNYGKKEFNAGVMLVNLEKWREKNVLKEALAIHKNPQVSLPDADQTVLNILFRDDWVEVSDTYNQQVFAGHPYVRRNNPVKRGAIIHYTTSLKPFTTFYKRLIQLVSLWLKHRKITAEEFIHNLYKVPLSDEWYRVARMNWTEVRKSQYENNTN